MGTMTIDGKICIEREINIHRNDNSFEDILTQFDILETCKWIEENNFHKVCLQFPDELLFASAKIHEEIKNRVDVDLYILGDTSYASCCVDSVAAMHVHGDAVVHYGRSCFTKTNIPTYTVLPKKLFNFEALFEIANSNFTLDEKICLFYDAEFEHCKANILQKWHLRFPKSYVSHISIEEKPNRFLGRIIRDINEDEVPVEVLQTCVCIYLGSKGQTVFNYTISIAAKDWYILDPDVNSLERMNETMWFKRRRFLIEKCKDAKVIGILVCKLAGDQTKDIICRMKQLCKVNGKKSYIVSVGKPNVAKLANFPEIDIYVMIACPENDLYSNRDFYKPIVYPFELDVALNTNRAPYFTTHITDYDDLLPGRKYYCDIDNNTEETDVSLITGKIRDNKINAGQSSGNELAERQNWALESIGQNLQDRSWKGLEQNLGETEVKKAEQGRKGLPLQYENEPE